MGLPALIAAYLAAFVAPTFVSPRADGEVLVARLRNEIIHTLTAQYLVDAIDQADREHAALLVIELDTPGGLVDPTKEIIQRMTTAETPIAVYVSPSAARAASGGFYLLISADVAAMAPGTNTGSAHVVDMFGGGGSQDGKEPSVEIDKAENDIAAFARTIGEHRRRNLDRIEEAVRKSSAFTETEALDGGLIQIVAQDRADLLKRLDGTTVRRFDGSTTVLHTRGEVREIEKSLLQRFVGPLLRPELVLLLLGLGMMGLYVEISHPGMIFPGVVGVLCLLLDALAFQFLPVNAIGLILVALGLGLFVLELKVASYGALTIGGSACILVGLLMIFPRDVPALRVSIAFVLPLAITVAAVMSFFVVLVARAQRTPVATGTQGMVGEEGRAATAVAPQGKVYVHGELWDARSASPVAAGDPVRVLAVEGARVVVEKKESKA